MTDVEPEAPPSPEAPDEAPPPALRRPLAAAICGAAIVAAAALPITPDGRSFVSLLLAEFHRGLLEGILMLSGFGSPFLFGLAVAAAGAGQAMGSSDRHKLARELVRAPIGLLHGQLLLVAFVVWRHGQAVAALPLLAFAIAGAAVYVRAGMAAPGGRTLALEPTVRWGATVVAGVAGWCRLQHLAGVHLGRAVDVVLVAAVLLVLVTRPRRA
ncbi:MAG: hypothetical protein K1X88_18820 [Nannocystaceae bacterium]|nr:hypothetical protein [Nannocystaceae bacterium]